MKKCLLLSMTVAALVSCSKDKDPVIVIPPTSGSTMTLEGLDGKETGSTPGANANNSVFVDFSTDKQTKVLRSSWDLGFYCGNDFKVKLNNTTFAFAKVTSKTDINAVGSTDTAGVLLTFNQGNPPKLTTNVTDDISGDLSKLVIPTISATELDNKVVIINRGIAGGVAARDFMKVRILRNGTGYTLQYAKLTETTFKTVQVSKNNDNDFIYVSLDNGTTVSDFPAKQDWDIQWTVGTYTTKFGADDVFYPFSDLIFINNLSGVTAFERVYADANTAADAYTKFNKDSVAKYTFLNDRNVISSNWRATTGAGKGVKKDRFYIVKDPAGNVYKLKFLSFTEEDGGTRGKPEIKYELIK